MTRRGRFGRRLPPAAPRVREQHEELRSRIGEALDGLDIYRSHEPMPPGRETPIRELRRRGAKPEDDRLGTMTLVDEDGVLRWEPTATVSAYAGRRRRRRGQTAATGTVVEQLRFERLERSQVGDFLTRLDHKINPVLEKAPAGKLRALTSSLALPEAVVEPRATGRVLLLVHGTFSHSQNFHDNLSATDDGKKFLGAALGKYQQVLFFDHPTLQVSPVINAVDLERQLRGSRATFDVVCHSRGGLVTRWWSEALNHDPTRVGKVVFVGSPLAGTSLAAPPKLKRTIDYLTNIFDALSKVSEMASNAQPLMVAVTGLLKVLTLAAKGVSRTPLLDVAVAAVPGLVGQSRVGDNAEIRRLREGEVPIDRYHSVISDFEPESLGWRFWRYFTRKPGQRLLNVGADLLFEDANDLVVDTASMSDFRSDLSSDIPAARTLEFETRDEVHHLNYFHQPKTVDFLSRVLLPGA